MNYIIENSTINCYYKKLKKVFSVINSLIDHLYTYLNDNNPNKIIILHYDSGSLSYHNPYNKSKNKFKKEIRNNIIKHQFNDHSIHQPLYEFEIKDYDEFIRESNELYITSQYF